jgi:transcriptional regulator GlxA family with amidase domain
MKVHVVCWEAHLCPGDRREAAIQTVVDLAATQDSADLMTKAVAKRSGVTQRNFDRSPEESWVGVSVSSAMLTMDLCRFGDRYK